MATTDCHTAVLPSTPAASPANPPPATNTDEKAMTGEDQTRRITQLRTDRDDLQAEVVRLREQVATLHDRIDLIATLAAELADPTDDVGG